MHRRFACLAVVMMYLAAAPALAQINTFNNLNTSQQTQITQARQQALSAVQNALNHLRAIGPAAIFGNSSTYNNNFGQFFDQSRANPLRGSYEAQLKGEYAGAEREIYFRGLDNFAAFTVLGKVQPDGSLTTVLQDRYPFDPVTGLLTSSPNLIYAHLPDSLYGPLDGVYNVGANIGVNALTFTPPTNLNINIGNFQRAAFEITNGVWSPAGAGPPNLIPTTFDHHYVNENRLGTGVDATRYRQLVQILTDIRDALATQNIAFEGDLEGAAGINRQTINNILGSSLGNVTRGFSQYGSSTSGSESYQDNQFAKQLTPGTPSLEWWQDTGKRNLLTGALLPGERNNFFEDKFGLLFDRNTNTLFVGQSALNGIEAQNDGLFDNSNNAGQFEASLPLWQQLIGALADGLAQGGREMVFGMDEISRQAGNPLVDAVSGQNNLFPQDRDIGRLLNFVSNQTVQTQGTINGTGIAQGKVLNASGGLNAVLDGMLVVPLF